MKRQVLLAALAVSLSSCGNFGCSNEAVVGGFGKAGKLTDEEKELFSDVVGKELNVKLTPVKVAHQVVSGTNYRFICRDNDRNTADVVIWQPLPGNGDAQLLSMSFGSDLSVLRLGYESSSQEQECEVSVDMPQGDSPLEGSIRKAIASTMSEYASMCREDRAEQLDIPEDRNAVADYFGAKWSKDMTEANQELSRAFADYQMHQYSFRFSMRLKDANDRYVTYEQTMYNYLGGAHGSTVVRYLTFSRKDGALVEEFFDPSKTEAMQPLLRRGVLSYLKENGNEVDDASLNEYLFVDGGVIPLPSTAPELVEDGLRFIYQQYEIGPYALGMVSFVLPYDDVKPYLKPDVMGLMD